MDAMLGVGLLALTVLLFAWAYGEFRRPDPKAWTRSNLAATSISLAMTFLVAFAVVFVGNAFLTLGSETRWLQIAAVAGGCLVVCWFLVPRLLAPARRVAGAPAGDAGAGHVPSDTAPQGPANDPRPTAPAQPGRPSGKPHKRRAA